MFIIDRKKIYRLIFSFVLIFSLATCLKSDQSVSETLAPLTSGVVVVIDPGHGLPDGGAVGKNGTLEHEINLSVSKELGSLLQQSGAKVVYTRENDYSIADNLDEKIRKIKRDDMKKRKEIKQSCGANLFISIHMNKFDDSKYKGAQVFYQSKSVESKNLAESVQKFLHNFADESNTREAKNSENSIFVLNDSQIPSILVECGFLSNAEEEAKLKTLSYQKQIAFSIFCGIVNYLNM